MVSTAVAVHEGRRLALRRRNRKEKVESCGVTSNIKIETFQTPFKVKIFNFYSDPSHAYCDKCGFVDLIVAVCGQTDGGVRSVDLLRQGLSADPSQLKSKLALWCHH